jgi:hypothetical protein
MNNKSSKYRGEESEASIKTLKVHKDYTTEEFKRDENSDAKYVSA